MSFHLASYEKHGKHYDAAAKNSSPDAHSRTWLQEDTANAWRHRRSYELFECLFEDPRDSWVTVGDGRYGCEAMALKRCGFENILATDICGALLEIGKEEGLIDAFAVENAENLSFPDDHFAYSFCKESYHHFPRPMLALYEMLRVSRKAVVLVEPEDKHNCWETRLRNLRARLRGEIKYKDTVYEGSGNYVYSISRRELEKVALGINLPTIAFQGYNDYYVPNAEYVPASIRQKEYRAIRLGCLKKDLLTWLGFRPHGMLRAILFKEEPSEGVRNRLRRQKWDIIDLPRNPHV